MKSKPIFTHNCPSCEFHGTFQVGDDQPLDLYSCGSNVLARFGNEPSEYHSGDLGYVGPLSNPGLQYLQYKILINLGVRGSSGPATWFDKDGPVRVALAKRPLQLEPISSHVDHRRQTILKG